MRSPSSANAKIIIKSVKKFFALSHRLEWTKNPQLTAPVLFESLWGLSSWKQLTSWKSWQTLSDLLAHQFRGISVSPLRTEDLLRERQYCRSVLVYDNQRYFIMLQKLGASGGHGSAGNDYCMSAKSWRGMHSYFAAGSRNFVLEYLPTLGLAINR